MTPSIGMIMAAGFGTRLRPLTGKVPKPLIRVNNKALIDYAIDNLCDIGIKKIIVNTHYLSSQIIEHLEKYKLTDIEIIISYEEQILGSGGGILNALNKVNQPLLVVNSDVYFDSTKPFQVLLNSWQGSKMDALIMLKDKNEIDYPQIGDFNLSADNKIIRSSDQNRYVLTSPYIVTPQLFDGYDIEPFSITDIFFKSNDRNFNSFEFYGVTSDYKWFDVGTHERLTALNRYLA